MSDVGRPLPFFVPLGDVLSEMFQQRLSGILDLSALVPQRLAIGVGTDEVVGIDEGRGAKLYVAPQTLEVAPYGRLMTFSVRSPEGAMIEFFQRLPA